MFIDKMMPLIEQKSKFEVTTFSNLEIWTSTLTDKLKKFFRCSRSSSGILESKLHQLKRNFRKYRTSEIAKGTKKKLDHLNVFFNAKNKSGVTYSIAETDIDKANLLANWFAQPPHPSKSSNEGNEHYEYVKDKICSVVQMSKEAELSEYYFDEITEEVTEAIRHLSAYKSQSNDNIHNLMLKNSGQSMENSKFVVILKPDLDPTICKNYRLPQGSILLFLLYINDISYEVYVPIQCGMFADDVALWASINTPKMTEINNQLQLLQQSLDVITLWSSKWKIVEPTFAPISSKNNESR
ncbi:hypothetical protein RFI_13599 [Reticulomyxa filosa]|uniref:Reverse transcriptase domain-containing protein n=1 Tax=Reticulomyxa filosa TaxID=46433 RepID=X6NBB4_RETFI|nr:hypothetical protein RFI_13599 [Reticulomyxa filosa]|eukprot:ETO23580.1 hypothetical protein RFI_13599 [Reticulomyxa filosa]